MISSNEAVSPAITRRTISSSAGDPAAGSERSSDGAACSANMGVGFRLSRGTAGRDPRFMPNGRHLVEELVQARDHGHQTVRQEERKVNRRQAFGWIGGHASLSLGRPGSHPYSS